MRLLFSHSWKDKKKSWKKISIKIRIGKVTLFDIYFDFNKWKGALIILNFGVRNEYKK